MARRAEAGAGPGIGIAILLWILRMLGLALDVVGLAGVPGDLVTWGQSVTDFSEYQFRALLFVIGVLIIGATLIPLIVLRKEKPAGNGVRIDQANSKQATSQMAFGGGNHLMVAGDYTVYSVPDSTVEPKKVIPRAYRQAKTFLRLSMSAASPENVGGARRRLLGAIEEIDNAAREIAPDSTVDELLVATARLHETASLDNHEMDESFLTEFEDLGDIIESIYPKPGSGRGIIDVLADAEEDQSRDYLSFLRDALIRELDELNKWMREIARELSLHPAGVRWREIAISHGHILKGRAEKFASAAGATGEGFRKLAEMMSYGPQLDAATILHYRSEMAALESELDDYAQLYKGYQSLADPLKQPMGVVIRAAHRCRSDLRTASSVLSEHREDSH